MLNRFRFMVLVSALLVASPASAGRIKRGFDALKIFNYFEAKKQFSKGMKYNPAPSAFGLAIIYSRSDNPFYQKDSADHYIRLAQNLYPTAKEGKKLKWKIYGWAQSGLDSLQQLIGDEFYHEVIGSNNVASMTTFLNDHAYSHRAARVTSVRDSLAFFKAVNVNTAEAYNAYVRSYPNSNYAGIARENYYDAQFEEITGEGTLASYLEFIQSNPNNPLVGQAEDRIYDIVTESNTVQAFEVFIDTYPNNRNLSKAWSELFQTYLADYSKERIDQFMNRYPGFPDEKKVLDESTYADSLLFPYMSRERYGFMNLNGVSVMDAMFDQVAPFHEGLAIVAMNGKYGAINKRGELQIPIKFDAMQDFIRGMALVELDGKMGMVHRNGRFVLECEYMDLGIFSDGLAFASKKGDYGYLGVNRKWRIKEQFDEAYDFSSGTATIELNGKMGTIDIYGTYLIQPVYETMKPFGDSLYIFEKNGKVGLANRLGHAIVQPKYDAIGNVSEGLAVAAYNDTLVYLNELGEVVIEGNFETFINYLEKGEFKNGAAIAVVDGKFGRINSKGSAVTEFSYRNLGTGEKAIPFEQKGSWGAMNLANKIIISRQYDYLEMVDDEVVLVVLEDSAGLIDIKGNTIVPLQYEDVTQLKKGIYLAESEMGIYLYKGNQLKTLDPVDRVNSFGEDFVILEKHGSLRYMRTADGVLIEFKEDL